MVSRAPGRIDAPTAPPRPAPFRSLGEAVMVGLTTTAVRAGLLFEEVLREHGVTGTQYNVLRILAGGPPGGYPRAAIIERLMFPNSDATRLIDRLARRGLVARHRSRDDGRVVLHEITAAGRRALRALDPVLGAMHARVEAVLGDAAARDLVLSCDAIRRAVAAGSLTPDASAGNGAS